MNRMSPNVSRIDTQTTERVTSNLADRANLVSLEQQLNKNVDKTTKATGEEDGSSPLPKLKNNKYKNVQSKVHLPRNPADLS